MIQTREVFLHWLAKSKSKECYEEVERIEIRVDVPMWDVGKITNAAPTDDCAKLLAEDEVISNRIELLALAAIDELQHYER